MKTESPNKKRMGEIPVGVINSGRDIHTCTKPLPYFSICLKKIITI